MRPTISELRNWRTHRFGEAAAAAASAAETLDGAMDAAIRAIDATSDWCGESRCAADLTVTRERGHVHEIRNILHRIADEAEDAGADLTHARELVLRVVDTALADGFVVTDLGEVASVDMSKEADAEALGVAIMRALDVIEQIDDDHGARLERLTDDLAAMRTGRPGLRLPDEHTVNPDDVVVMLRSMTATARRELWSRMTPDDRRRVMHADPQTIGNLDGVDFDTRADANEINIRNALTEERQAGRGGGPRAAVLEEFAQRGPDGTAERRFIAFDNTADGRFIEMVGAVGTGTRNATVYVPGTRSSMNRSAESHGVAQDLAQRTGGPVFVYLDGDLPQKVGFEGLPDVVGRGAVAGLLGIGSGLAASIDDSAVETGFARDMAPRLVGFGAALDAELEQRAPEAITTFIGFSYGGSVVGSAEQLGLRADRVVYASAAGTGVFDGPWRNPNPDVDRYSLTAPGDPIQYIQSVPGNPHGSDPDTAAGVVRMDTGFTGPDANGQRTLIEGTSSHGSYWHDPNSDAFRNIVRVINGDDPTPYIERAPDRPTDPYAEGLLDIVVEGGRQIIRDGLGPLGDLLDGDIDLPGPIPDIPLRLPW
ncbi:hypothetical protein [Gordonia hankookensis]|uniref:Alpha/beta hydrolase n=1 Tax=Gordonia hankookensis TaxID=589403 RepID=A0ABR7W8A4_9ACTN|nr:hypothetical protein [Gordonia hankookensis]MBD1319054.1 hypothetical protein [Gordonia hankookensis]